LRQRPLIPTFSPRGGEKEERSRSHGAILIASEFCARDVKQRRFLFVTTGLNPAIHAQLRLAGRSVTGFGGRLLLAE